MVSEIIEQNVCNVSTFYFLFSKAGSHGPHCGLIFSDKNNAKKLHN